MSERRHGAPRAIEAFGRRLLTETDAASASLARLHAHLHALGELWDDDHYAAFRDSAERALLELRCALEKARGLGVQASVLAARYEAVGANGAAGTAGTAVPPPSPRLRAGLGADGSRLTAPSVPLGPDRQAVARAVTGAAAPGETEATLEALRATYQVPAQLAARRLAALLPRARLTWSVKQTGSLAAKLTARRGRAAPLPGDIGRCEVVLAPRHMERAVAAIVGAWGLGPGAVEAHDDPVTGYRGIHVQLQEAGRSVEVQLHTPAEHRYWAWSHAVLYKDGALAGDARALDFGLRYRDWLLATERGEVQAPPAWPEALPAALRP